MGSSKITNIALIYTLAEMKNIIAKITNLCRCKEDHCVIIPELNYYVNRHLEDSEKWKLIFDLISRSTLPGDINEYFQKLVNSAAQVLSVSQFVVILYDSNLNNRIFSLDTCEESEFLNATIFNHYRYYDVLDELKTILKDNFLLLPITRQENEYGYMFLRFKNPKDMQNEVNFPRVLSEHVALTLEHMYFNETLRRESDERVRFLIELSHELKVPLNAIAGYSDILKENSSVLDGKLMECVTNISSASKQLKALVVDIIEDAKISQGKAHIRKEEFSTKNEILCAIDVFKAKIVEKELDVIPILIDFNLFSDLTKFNQVLYNLISNAVKFSAQKGKINIVTWCDGIKFYFEISNEGRGLKETELSNIFGFMYQAESNIEANKDGSGIGLAVTKKIIELQGGEIQFSSSPENDTTIRFNLPIC